jgi:hypothetical protein
MNNQNKIGLNPILSKFIIQRPCEKVDTSGILKLCKKDTPFARKKRRYKKYKRRVDSCFKYTVKPIFPDLNIVHTEYCYSYIYGYCLLQTQMFLLKTREDERYRFGFPLVGIPFLNGDGKIRIRILDAYQSINPSPLVDENGYIKEMCHVFHPSDAPQLLEICAFREDDIQGDNYLIDPIKSANSLYLAYLDYDDGKPFNLKCHKHFSKPGDPD